jgi:hypothetical protein
MAMTPQEQNVLQEIAEKVDRIEIALVGDGPFGNPGLVHRVEALETTMEIVEPVARILSIGVRNWPAVAVAIFFLLTGGNPGAALEFVSRLLR